MLSSEASRPTATSGSTSARTSSSPTLGTLSSLQFRLSFVFDRERVSDTDIPAARGLKVLKIFNKRPIGGRAKASSSLGDQNRSEDENDDVLENIRKALAAQLNSFYNDPGLVLENDVGRVVGKKDAFPISTPAVVLPNIYDRIVRLPPGREVETEYLHEHDDDQHEEDDIRGINLNNFQQQHGGGDQLVQGQDDILQQPQPQEETRGDDPGEDLLGGRRREQHIKHAFYNHGDAQLTQQVDSRPALVLGEGSKSSIHYPGTRGIALCLFSDRGWGSAEDLYWQMAVLPQQKKKHIGSGEKEQVVMCNRSTRQIETHFSTSGDHEGTTSRGTQQLQSFEFVTLSERALRGVQYGVLRTSGSSSSSSSGSIPFFSILGLYSLLVYAAFKLIRSAYDNNNSSERVIYTELEDTTFFEDICDGIYLARALGDLDTEWGLYMQLLRLYRSPAMLLEYSTPQTARMEYTIRSSTTRQRY
ncbi:unnamed protein product [Amoebophrya sp. A25]|nr:unnamed protein product [Amoebophrya sp. A25]|eukprot:GSA25T00022873001.1